MKDKVQMIVRHDNLDQFRPRSAQIRVTAAPFRAVFGGRAAYYASPSSDSVRELSKSDVTCLSQMLTPKPCHEHARTLAFEQLTPLGRQAYLWVHRRASFSGQIGSNVGAIFERVGDWILSHQVDKEVMRIKRFVATGLVIQEDKLMAELFPPQQDERCYRAQARSFGIITADRPAMLRRALSSMTVSSVSVRSNRRTIVIDDSREQANQIANRALAAEIRESSTSELILIGQKQRDEFAHSVITLSGVSSELIHFALGNKTRYRSVGAARNVGHLVAAENLAIFSDDDTIAQYVVGDEHAPVLITSAPAQFDVANHTGRSEWLSSAQFTAKADFSERMEGVIGKSIQDLALPNDALLGTIDLELMTALRGQNCSVGLCSVGTSGDCGMWSSAGFVLGASSRLVNTTQSDREYERLRSGRYITRVPRQLQVTSDANFQTMSYGIDLQYLKLPFFPFGRNTDGAFGVLARKVCPQRLFAHIPVGIYHDPEVQRVYTLDPVRALLTLRMTDWLILLLGSVPLVPPSNSAAGLQVVGQQLAEVLSVSSEAFLAYLRMLVMKQRISTASRASLMLEERSLPPRWKQDLRQIISHLTTEEISVESLVPLELRGMSVTESTSIMIKNLRLYSTLLCQWGIISDAAGEMMRDQSTVDRFIL